MGDNTKPNQIVIHLRSGQKIILSGDSIDIVHLLKSLQCKIPSIFLTQCGNDIVLLRSDQIDGYHVICSNDEITKSLIDALKPFLPSDNTTDNAITINEDVLDEKLYDGIEQDASQNTE